MSGQDLETMNQQAAWDALAVVEEHPQIREWLKAAEAKPVRRAPSRRVWAAAAGVLLALGAGLAAYIELGSLRYETQIGEQRDVLLPDGSRMTLNTDTALVVRYSGARRYIELKRGEALFTVKHDAARPFEVAAGGTLTRALGTEFNVDLRNARVTVSVLEGAVRVVAADEAAARRADAPRGGPASLAALGKGEALEFRPRERRVVEEKADLKRIDAWRTRRLEFSDTPLSDALEEFNRYSTTRVTLGTAELRSVRVSGVFRIGDADGFLFSLQEALKVQAYQSADEVVLVRAAR